MKIILLGPPGSGKGTVAEKLCRDFGLTAISAGVLLRDQVDKNTEIANEIKAFMEKGKLVPNEFVVQLMKLEIDGKDNYILDGFPRSMNQAKEIEDIKIDLVIYLEVPEDVVVERFAGRRLDPVTGEGYHLKYIPPPEDIKDRLIQRPDDRPEIVKQRFRVFHKENQPLVDYYKKKGTLITVDGAPMPDIVYADVKRILSEKI